MVEFGGNKSIRGKIMKLHRWYYHLRGQVYAYGPIGPMTLEDAKKSIRDGWGGGKRVPYGTQIWKE